MTGFSSRSHFPAVDWASVGLAWRTAASEADKVLVLGEFAVQQGKEEKPIQL